MQRLSLHNSMYPLLKQLHDGIAAHDFSMEVLPQLLADLGNISKPPATSARQAQEVVAAALKCRCHKDWGLLINNSTDRSTAAELDRVRQRRLPILQHSSFASIMKLVADVCAALEAQAPLLATAPATQLLKQQGKPVQQLPLQQHPSQHAGEHAAVRSNNSIQQLHQPAFPAPHTPAGSEVEPAAAAGVGAGSTPAAGAHTLYHHQHHHHHQLLQPQHTGHSNDTEDLQPPAKRHKAGSVEGVTGAGGEMPSSSPYLKAPDKQQ